MPNKKKSLLTFYAVHGLFFRVKMVGWALGGYAHIGRFEDCGTTFKNSDIFTFFLDIFTWSMNISAAS